MEFAVTDALTGLHNRRYLDTHLRAIYDEATRRERALSLLLLDIDRFKSVNDTYGHDAGDEVLREFANRVRALTRGIDVVARFGGEEIVIVVPDTALDGARAVAERIREQVSGTPFVVQHGLRRVAVTVSIGVAARPDTDASAADLLKRADLALYQAKHGGRNQVVAAAA